MICNLGSRHSAQRAAVAGPAVVLLGGHVGDCNGEAWSSWRHCEFMSFYTYLYSWEFCRGGVGEGLRQCLMIEIVLDRKF